MVKYNNSYLPLVSIIVATYHRDLSLKRALYSLVSQTYKNIEIIVIDDNAEIEWNGKVYNIIKNVENYFNHKIIYIKNDVNKGSAETRNIGIRVASGEFVTFLDDDDEYLPKKVEKQVFHMSKEGSDYSITDLELYDENNKLVEKRKRNYIKNMEVKQLVKYHLMFHMTGTDTIMFRKDYLVKIGGFSPVNVGDEFYLMHKAILNNGKFSYLPSCEVKAIIHSTTEGLSNGDGKIKGENSLYNYKMKFFNQLNYKEKNYIKMRHYAVIAFAEYRRKNIFGVLVNSILSFISNPVQFIKLLICRK